MASFNYHEKRAGFYSRIPNFWPDLYSEEYALYDIAFESSQEYEKIRQAGARIGHIFLKSCGLLRTIADESLLDMGFPKDSLPFLRIRTLTSESVIARLDLVKTTKGYKCIEINSDTPTFVKECFCVNGLVCREFNAQNPNEGTEQWLASAIRNSILEAAGSIMSVNPYIVFTAHGDNIEDRETSRYLMELSGFPSRFVPLDKLEIIRGDGLYDDKGIRIDVLYRQTFPVENMIADEDADGNKIGLWLLELVAEKKLSILNPPSAFLLQNKAVQAVIWGLHEENNAFFTPEEHSWIQDYFLPSYLDPEPFLDKGEAFVKKPVFGREGDTVEIYTGRGELALADKHSSYGHFLSLYQKYVDLPKCKFQSLRGDQEGKVLTGCFLLNGQPSAIGFRAGGQITDNYSYYLPAGMVR